MSPNSLANVFLFFLLSSTHWNKSSVPSAQVSSQDPGRAPLLLSAECQRSGTVTRVSLDYHCCPATAPSTQLAAVQVLLPLDHTATDLQCQPPASWLVMMSSWVGNEQRSCGLSVARNQCYVIILYYNQNDYFIHSSRMAIHLKVITVFDWPAQMST